MNISIYQGILLKLEIPVSSMSSWSSLHCCSAETHRSSSAYLLVKLIAHFLQQLLVFTADRSGIITSEKPACDGTVIHIRC